ncbi:MAG: adenylyltransferase/cytidyltransferase family protein [Rhodospirillaceae bacterium]|nr:adenylyltransferase/cytidyltransferase family protein [Rhodospirillaceae bacterium]
MTEPTPESPVRVYIDLIGDLFHAGHLRHLEKARSLGDTVVIGVFDDETAA